MAPTAALRLLQAIWGPISHNTQPKCLERSKRLFHTSQFKATDGVYKAITEMRIHTPWIEALRKSREESAGAPTELVKPDLSPKKMSDSFVKFVSLQEHWPIDCAY